MTNWRCPKCNAENQGNFCSQCGQPRPEPEATRVPSAPGFRGLGHSILDEVKNDLASSLGNRSTDRLSSSVSVKLPDLGLDLSDVGLKMPDLGLPRVQFPFERVTTRDLRLRLQVLPRLNYALAHCGIPLIPELEIHNDSGEPAQDVLIKAWLATDYGEPWQKTVPAIPPRKRYIEENIVLPLQKSRLQQVREAERANLRVDIYTEGAVQVSETVPVEVLAYNEWYYDSNWAALMACFVQPNSPAIEKIISAVRDRLRNEFRDTSLDGYQSRDPKKVVSMLEALYYTLQKDLQLTYINPPPSFERPEKLPDGTLAMSQKVFLPEQIVEHRRGTCLDLALLCAACVERMGLNPVCFLVRGHAFYGVWLSENSLKDPVVSDISAVGQLVESGMWLPLNSTTFASSTVKRFADCCEQGRLCLQQMELMCAVDVVAARRDGFKPIPPLVTS